MADATVEQEVKKKLEDVTKRLLRREAELQFARSEEGKAITAQVKQAEVRLRLEERNLEIKDRVDILDAEIAEAQKEYADVREIEHDKLIKREKELEKLRDKTRKREEQYRRDHFKELLESLNPFKALGKAMGAFIPKPIKILGSWGAHLSKKWGGRLLRGMGRMAMRGGRAGIKGIASVIRGRSPAEAETATPEAVPETAAVPRKTTKLDPKAFLLTSKTQPLYEDEPTETVPEEGILGKTKKGFSEGGISGAAKALFGGDEEAAKTVGGETVETPQDGFGILHTDLVGIYNLLNARLPEGPDASVEREGDIESKDPAAPVVKKKGKKKGIIASAIGAVTGGLGISDAMGSMVGTAFGPKIAKTVAGMGKFMLPAAIVAWGVASAALVIKDFLAGAEDGGTAGGIAKALGGDAAGGAKNALGQGLKFAGIGATIGLAFPPVGWIIGALIGAAFGGIVGWFGSDKIKKGIDGVTDFFGFPVLMTEDEKAAHQKKIDDISTKIANLKSEIIPQIDKEIAVYTKLQAEGKQLTLQEMEKLDELYQQKADAQQQIIDGEKEKAVLERDLERQKLANLNQQKSELKDTKTKLTMTLTEVGDTGRFVHGEIFALQEEIRVLDNAINKAKKEGHESEVAMLTNQKAIAEKQLDNKKTMLTKVNEELDKTADEIYAEQQRLSEEGLLSGWEEFTFDMKTMGRGISGMWDKTTAQLAGLGKKIGAFIYTPGGESGPGGMGEGTPAKLFGVELKWPDFGALIGNFTDGLAGMLPSWMTTPIGELSWPEFTMPDLSGVLNLPEWMTEKDFFKFDWPDINIEDLTEGVKNMVRGLLPDPVDDPWLYKLVPQKVYDWLGVPTAVREAEAEMAEASQELQKLEQKRRETEKRESSETGWFGDLYKYSDKNKADDLAEIDAEILEATKKQANATTILEQAQAGGTIPLAVALYSKTGQPQDLSSTAAILGAGGGGGSGAVVVNNITNAMGGSTSAPTSVTNMNIMAGANDPYTSKQPNHAFGNY